MAYSRNISNVGRKIVMEIVHRFTVMNPPLSRSQDYKIQQLSSIYTANINYILNCPPPPGFSQAVDISPDETLYLSQMAEKHSRGQS